LKGKGKILNCGGSRIDQAIPKELPCGRERGYSRSSEKRHKPDGLRVVRKRG